jgi:hypothetical protein
LFQRIKPVLPDVARLSQSLLAAVENTVKQKCIFHILEAGKSKIKVLADVVFGEGSQMLPSSCVLSKWRRQGSCLGLSQELQSLSPGQTLVINPQRLHLQ